MAETLGTGVIELVADARKLKAGIEDAKRAFRSLGEGQRDISKSAAASIDRYIGKLQQQNATFGKSVRETELFKLALRGASDEQIKSADAALRFAENNKKSADAMAKLKTDATALGKVLGTAIVTGAVAAAAGFEILINRAAAFQDMSEKVGDSADAIASLAVAAAVGGKGMEEISEFAIKLGKNLVGVDDDADKAGSAILALGLDIEKFKALKPVDQIEALAKALDGFQDGAGKSNVLEALAKGSAQLLPFLKELAGETGRQNILTAEQIRLADEHADQQAKLAKQIDLHAQAIAIQLLPQITEFKKGILDLIKGLSELDKAQGSTSVASEILGGGLKAVTVVFQTMAVLASDVGFVLLGVGREIGAIAAQMAALARLDFKGFTVIGDAVKEDGKRARAELDKFQAAVLALGQPNQFANVRSGSSSATTPTRRPLVFEGARKKDTSDTSRQDAAAQLAFDLQQIKAGSDAQIDEFRRAESIMQALRSAALVDDRDYFASKLGFITSFAREEEAALQAQIERRQREVFTGKDATKDRLDNERQIAALQAQIAKIRADSVAKTAVNAIEEQAAIRKVQQAYEDARNAAQAYLETIDRRNAREVAGIGRGQRFREDQGARGDIDDRLLVERRRLEGELRRGQITRDQFNTYLQIAQETYAKEVELYEARSDAILRAEGDWLNGALEALNNYADEARNVAKTTEGIFTNAFKSAEDALTDFLDKADFSAKSLKDTFKKIGDSIASDLNRAFVKEQITGPLAEFLKGKEGGPSPIARIGEIFTGRPAAGATSLVDDGRPIQGVPAWLNALMGRTSGGASRFPTVDVVEGTIAKAGIPGIGGAADAAAGTAFSAAVTTAGTGFATAATTAGTTLGTELATAGGSLTGEIAGAGATLGTELATAGASIAAEIAGGGASFALETTTAGATFAAEVAAAGAAFAASVATASATSSVSSGASGLLDIFGGLDFAEGGQVTGPGTGTSDSIPAMVSNQEFIVKAAKATEPGTLPFLKTVNDYGLAAALAAIRKTSSLAPTVGAAARSVSNVIPFARGGIVRQPEHFPLPGGKTGLRGEAGPEAILPIKQGGVIVAGRPDLRLPLTRDVAGNMAVDLPDSILATLAGPIPSSVPAALPIPAPVVPLVVRTGVSTSMVADAPERVIGAPLPWLRPKERDAREWLWHTDRRPVPVPAPVVAPPSPAGLPAVNLPSFLPRAAAPAMSISQPSFEAEKMYMGQRAAPITIQAPAPRVSVETNPAIRESFRSFSATKPGLRETMARESETIERIERDQVERVSAHFAEKSTRELRDREIAREIRERVESLQAIRNDRSATDTQLTERSERLIERLVRPSAVAPVPASSTHIERALIDRQRESVLPLLMGQRAQAVPAVNVNAQAASPVVRIGIQPSKPADAASARVMAQAAPIIAMGDVARRGWTRNEAAVWTRPPAEGSRTADSRYRALPPHHHLPAIHIAAPSISIPATDAPVIRLADPAAPVISLDHVREISRQSRLERETHARLIQAPSSPLTSAAAAALTATVLAMPLAAAPVQPIISPSLSSIANSTTAVHNAVAKQMFAPVSTVLTTIAGSNSAHHESLANIAGNTLYQGDRISSIAGDRIVNNATSAHTDSVVSNMMRQGNVNAATTTINNSAMAAPAAAPVINVAPAAVPFIGSFERGIAFVPQAGLAMLHQGERVMTRAENEGGSGQMININMSFAPGTDRSVTNHMLSELRRELARNGARGF